MFTFSSPSYLLRMRMRKQGAFDLFMRMQHNEGKINCQMT